MKRSATIQEAIQRTKGGYDIVPANITLVGAEQELSQTGKAHRLKKAVALAAGEYSYFLPSNGRGDIFCDLDSSNYRSPL